MWPTARSTGAVTEPVGVGPHPEPWPTGPHFDPELLRDGTDQYQHVRYVASAAELAVYGADAGYEVVGIDNLPGSVPLESFTLPADALLLFGQGVTACPTGTGDRFRRLLDRPVRLDAVDQHWRCRRDRYARLDPSARGGCRVPQSWLRR